ncbi:hypothetical protein ABT366_31370, partial [Streptomyces lydicus]
PTPRPGVRAAPAPPPPPRAGGVVGGAAPPPPHDTTDAALLEHLGRFFDPAVLPARFVRMPSIPRTATGKVLRPRLRELLAATPRARPATGPQS